MEDKNNINKYKKIKKQCNICFMYYNYFNKYNHFKSKFHKNMLRHMNILKKEKNNIIDKYIQKISLLHS